MFQDSNTKELSKTGGKHLFCKASVHLARLCKKTIHRHPASKLASADVLLSTALAGLTLQKRKNRENRSINDDVNVNLRFKSLFTLSG